MLFGSFLNSGLSIEDVTIEILRFHGFKLKLDNTTIKEYIEAIVLHLCKREFHRKKNPGTYDSSFEKDITKVKFEYLQYLNLLEKLKSDSEKYFSNTQLDFFKKSNLMKEYELEILNKYILDAKKKKNSQILSYIEKIKEDTKKNDNHNELLKQINNNYMYQLAQKKELFEKLEELLKEYKGYLIKTQKNEKTTFEIKKNTSLEITGYTIETLLLNRIPKEYYTFRSYQEFKAACEKYYIELFNEFSMNNDDIKHESSARTKLEDDFKDIYLPTLKNIWEIKKDAA